MKCAQGVVMLLGFGKAHEDQNGFGPLGIFPGIATNLKSRIHMCRYLM
jgi:hypothetical protein